MKFNEKNKSHLNFLLIHDQLQVLVLPLIQVAREKLNSVTAYFELKNDVNNSFWLDPVVKHWIRTHVCCFSKKQRCHIILNSRLEVIQHGLKFVKLCDSIFILIIFLNLFHNFLFLFSLVSIPLLLYTVNEVAFRN